MDRINTNDGPPPLPNPVRVPWNIWWTLLWGIVLVCVWQTVTGLGMVIALITSNSGDLSVLKKLGSEELLELIMDGDVLGLMTFLSIFVVCPMAWLIGKVKLPWGGWEYLGNRAVRWWKWPMWLIITFVFGMLLTLFGPILGLEEMDESMVIMARTTDYPILLFLGVALGAPLIEEFIFRGVIWRGWRGETQVGLWVTLVLTSAIWAVMHLQYPPIVISFIFLFGIILGLAREKTGNVWVPVAMHALNNGLAVIAMLQADL